MDKIFGYFLTSVLHITIMMKGAINNVSCEYDYLAFSHMY